ncbi:BTB/POZ/Kelch-associated protein [Klebsormidium nitens]|uniref:BTB/POZ/Kelch-associated protein n=1 Tax=Klebsormidium nitens TaxID=105231 RepID=A0A1Y1HSK7_KLENI|nr:BTB/POZ/Kelch-associated protein [Klebsormidium nitens]|eukprot:GAQ81093.1 BTB/POZ/Kelch-associated protein [Klebsormidium nitens]
METSAMMDGEGDPPESDLDEEGRYFDFSAFYRKVEYSDRTIRLEVLEEIGPEPEASGTSSEPPSKDAPSSDTAATSAKSSREVEEIPISSIVVAAKSQVLRTMLSSGMRESEKGAPLIIKVSREEKEAFEEMFHFIYAGSLSPRFHDPSADMRDHVALLVLADKFEVPSFMGQRRARARAVERRPKAKRLADEARAHVVRAFRDVSATWASPEFFGLGQGAVEISMQSEELEADSEEDVFVQLLGWIRERYSGMEERKAVMTRLLPSVRFNCMRGEFLEELLTYGELDSAEAVQMIERAFRFIAYSDEKKREAFLKGFDEDGQLYNFSGFYRDDAFCDRVIRLKIVHRQPDHQGPLADSASSLSAAFVAALRSAAQRYCAAENRVTQAAPKSVLEDFGTEDGEYEDILINSFVVAGKSRVLRDLMLSEEAKSAPVILAVTPGEKAAFAEMLECIHTGRLPLLPDEPDTDACKVLDRLHVAVNFEVSSFLGPVLYHAVWKLPSVWTGNKEGRREAVKLFKMLHRKTELWKDVKYFEVNFGALYGKIDFSDRILRLRILDTVEQEKAAVVEMLRFLYTGSLPSRFFDAFATPGRELLALLLAADKFEVPSLTAAVICAFRSRMPNLLDSSLLLDDIPESVHQCPEIAELLDSARDNILEAFGNVGATWASNCFLGLSLGALEVLLTSDQLDGSPEEIILQQLLRWIRKLGPNVGSYRERCNALEARRVAVMRLAPLIRFENMRTEFLRGLLRQWPELQPARKLIEDATRHRLSHKDFERGLVARGKALNFD